MNFKQFLDFVEIKTKLASMLPLTFGSLFVIYNNEPFYLNRFILFFLSLLLIDMTTTAINNYMDYKKSNIDIYKKNENIIGREQINLKVCKNIIFTMLFIAVAFGITLTTIVGIPLLFIGGLSFIVGIFYTYGPIPISRTPFGEIVSGLFMGFVILFIAIYIHMDSLLHIEINNDILFFMTNIIVILEIFLISLPFVLCISNLMLANNICDLEMDIKNNRYTLPYYIGLKKSLYIYNFNYYLIYLVIVMCTLLQIYEPIMLLSTLSAFIVHKHIKMFNQKQVKSKTFILSVKNLLIVSIFYIVPLVIGIFL